MDAIAAVIGATDAFRYRASPGCASKDSGPKHSYIFVNKTGKTGDATYNHSG